jgi:hypothetical protein
MPPRSTVALRFEKLDAECASLKTEDAQSKNEGTQTTALERARASEAIGRGGDLIADFAGRDSERGVARRTAGPAPDKSVVVASVPVQQWNLALQSPTVLAENAQWDEGRWGSS